MKKRYELYSGLTSGLLHSIFFLYAIPLFYNLGEERYSFSDINTVVAVSVFFGGIAGFFLLEKKSITTESIYIYSMIAMFLSTAFFSWIPPQFLIYLLAIVFFMDSIRFVKTSYFSGSIISFSLYYVSGWLFISFLFSFIPVFMNIRWFFLLLRLFSLYLIVMIFQFMGEHKRREVKRENSYNIVEDKIVYINIFLRFCVILMLSFGRGFYLSDSLSEFYDKMFLISISSIIILFLMKKSSCRLCSGNRRILTYIDVIALLMILLSLFKSDLIDPLPITFLYLPFITGIGIKRENSIFLRIIYFMMIFLSVAFYRYLSEYVLEDNILLLSSAVLCVFILIADLFIKD